MRKGTKGEKNEEENENGNNIGTGNTANNFLWNTILIVLLCGTGIYYTIRLKFIQVRKFGEACKVVFGNFSLKGAKGKNGEMTPFQSIATAIAAQVGTGNLAGAATALIGGGPGAIFWMWVSAFFGMATIYAEATLAQKYKTVVDGEVTGGPTYYIRAAFKGRFGKILAVFLPCSSYWHWDLWEIWYSPTPLGLHFLKYLWQEESKSLQLQLEFY